MLACNDPGEDPKKGGLLVAGYGQGTYLYTGYSFFNQLPAGVPGAFRLFANILALPEARILERIEFLKNISLVFHFEKRTSGLSGPNYVRAMGGKWQLHMPPRRRRK